MWKHLNAICGLNEAFVLEINLTVHIVTISFERVNCVSIFAGELYSVSGDEIKRLTQDEEALY